MKRNIELLTKFIEISEIVGAKRPKASGARSPHEDEQRPKGGWDEVSLRAGVIKNIITETTPNWINPNSTPTTIDELKKLRSFALEAKGVLEEAEFSKPEDQGK